MKRTSIIILAGLIALVCASQAPSQTQKKKPAPRGAKPAPTPAPDMRAEAQQVATQIKNVSNFIYVYGKIVNTLEVAEEQAKSNQTSPEIQARNKKSKEALVAKIRDLRAGLEAMANNFKANPRFQIQYLKLTYASDAVLNAEGLAASGRYNEAGQQLVTAVERLTDTIVSMRLL